MRFWYIFSSYKNFFGPIQFPEVPLKNPVSEILFRRHASEEEEEEVPSSPFGHEEHHRLRGEDARKFDGKVPKLVDANILMIETGG